MENHKMEILKGFIIYLIANFLSYQFMTNYVERFDYTPSLEMDMCIILVLAIGFIIWVMKFDYQKEVLEVKSK